MFSLPLGFDAILNHLCNHKKTRRHQGSRLDSASWKGAKLNIYLGISRKLGLSMKYADCFKRLFC